MATIHIAEVQRWLVERGQLDAVPGSREGFFLEIRFDNPSHDAIMKRNTVVDDDYKHKVLTVDTYLGVATIVFDAAGMLRSIDIC